jgi:hypothetical protein
MHAYIQVALDVAVALGARATNVRVTGLREGSVIVGLEATPVGPFKAGIVVLFLKLQLAAKNAIECAHDVAIVKPYSNTWVGQENIDHNHTWVGQQIICVLPWFFLRARAPQTPSRGAPPTRTLGHRPTPYSA